MRLLFILPEPPFPLCKGPVNHIGNLLNIASKEHVCTLYGIYQDKQAYDRWIEAKHVLGGKIEFKLFQSSHRPQSFWCTIKAFFLLELISMSKSYSTTLSKALISLTRKDFDILIWDRYSVVSHSLNPSIPSIFLPHDYYSRASSLGIALARSLREKAYWFIYWLIYKKLEKKYPKRFDIIAPVSEVDAQFYRQHHSDAHVLKVGIAVDDAVWQKKKQCYASPKPKIVAHGVFGLEALSVELIDFLKKDYPRLREMGSAFEFTIWSKSLCKPLREILNQSPDIHWIEWVDDYYRCLAEFDIYFYPQTYGSGIQTKLQEAMALGLPAVVRREIASALGIQHNKRECLVCDHAEDVAQALQALIENAGMRQAIGMRASAFIRDQYGHARIRAQLNRALDLAQKLTHAKRGGE